MTTLHDELASFRPQGVTAITLGVFDGVHRGHQHLIHHLQAVAARHGTTPVVVTFRNHPITVLRPDVSLLLLTPLEDRLAMLRSTGVKHVVPITFSRDLSLLTAEEFVVALQNASRMTQLVVGPDFAIGHQRQGTIPVLEQLGAKHGFSVIIAPSFTTAGVAVNSTAVRAVLAAGDVRQAAIYLNRLYSIDGSVGRGEGRGAKLGFPTANLLVPPGMAVPADGVYATWMHVGAECYQAATSIGSKPTFHAAGPREVEAHALDFQGDLYGRQVRLEFADRVRGQEQFRSSGALVERMRQDVASVRKLLAKAPAAAESWACKTIQDS
jgi:riboflavin kinase/FMN adenylyltransferase